MERGKWDRVGRAQPWSGPWLGGAVEQICCPGRALVLSKGVAVQEAAGSVEGLW